MEGFDRGEVDAKRRDVDRLMATPAKHYVRRHIWLPVAAERRQRVGGPLQYFTLTTSDLIDVRLLEQEGIIERTPRGYPGVGICEFNDKEYTEIMRRLRWCRWSYKGAFEDMVRDHPTFDTDFYFDVINLDFILVPFPGQESPLEGTWGAIQRVLRVQWQHQRSFDLFLTFRGSRSGTNEDALTKVAELLGQNLQIGRGAAEFKSRVGHLDPSRLLNENYVEFLCIGLPKLVIGDALELGFQMTRADVYRYPREGSGGPYDIVKFVISLDVPPTPRREFGNPPRLVSSYDAAVQEIFMRCVVDVADILAANPPLRIELEGDLKTFGV